MHCCINGNKKRKVLILSQLNKSIKVYVIKKGFWIVRFFKIELKQSKGLCCLDL